MKKLSILIPTYNRRERLEKTFPEIISNRSNEIEYIIIDNNSTDGTDQFFKPYLLKDKRIKYYKNHSNIGPNRNIYRAFLESNSKWVTIFPDDDFISRKFIDELIIQIDRFKECGLIISAKQNQSSPFKKTTKISKGYDAINFAFKSTSVITCLCFKSSLIEEKKWLLDNYIYPQVRISTNISFENDILYFIPKNKPLVGEWSEKLFELETRPKDFGIFELLEIIQKIRNEKKVHNANKLYYESTSSKFLWVNQLFFLMVEENEKKAILFLKNITKNKLIKASIFFWIIFLKNQFRYVNKPKVIIYINIIFIKSIIFSFFSKELYKSLFFILFNYHFFWKKYKLLNKK